MRFEFGWVIWIGQRIWIALCFLDIKGLRLGEFGERLNLMCLR